MSTRRKKRRLWLVLFALTGVLLLVGAWIIFGPNLGARRHGNAFYIRTGMKYDDVLDSLQGNGFISSKTSFGLLAGAGGLEHRIRPGRYVIPKGASNFSIVRLLRSGRQTPVQLVIRKVRTAPELARMLAGQVEADSAAWMHALLDTGRLSAAGLDTPNAINHILANTYEVYWTWKPDRILTKVEAYSKDWWTPARIAAAKEKVGSQRAAIILASIVDEESNLQTDRDTVASAYLNRLRQGMKLQADPTARFAAGDFGLRRITSRQTTLESPYNTYYVNGLPPGPICIPSEGSLRAVLGAPQTNYVYFCAKPNGSGRHAFAATYSAHLENARAYQQWLNERGIR